MKKEKLSERFRLYQDDARDEDCEEEDITPENVCYYDPGARRMRLRN